MKILHTADLHLTEKHAERWQALEKIIVLGRQHNIQALVISGDLFDQDVEAENLRVQFREMIGTADFHTVILPGNHDYKAYRSGLYFGHQVSIISRWDQPVHLDDITIWGLPYSKITKIRLINQLLEMSEIIAEDRFNVLLYHGELLDAFFTRHELGDEGEQRYMPAKLSYFAPLPVHYVLAGHFHSRYASWPIPGRGQFIYSGSPVSITSKEVGKRAVNLISHEAPPLELTIETAYYRDLTIYLDPFSAIHPLEVFKQHLQGLDAKAKIKLTVNGFYNGYEWGLSEIELTKKINDALSGYDIYDAVFAFIDIQQVMEDELYKKYLQKLSGKDFSPQEKDDIDQMVINAFRGIKSCE